jgi:CheY-like chemotaxis protein
LTDATPESALYERIAQIEIAAMRAAELTNQMLAYSGKGRFVVQPLDLSLVVGEMSNLLQTAVTKTARLDLRLGADLPAIQADPVQLRQVVMNLITNASDAIGASQGAITVSTGRMHASREYLAESYLVSQVADGEYVYFDVRDDGCGMDEETRARIFDPFFTTKFAGRGLGLAAVLGIVRGHHGAIRIESTPGKGTAFRVLFPAAAAVAIPEATAPAAAAPARRDGCILVVDDEPSVLAVARETLKRAGFTVLTASDGLAAVEQFRNHAGTIDLVLMDMTMPRMSGVRAMHAIRAIRADACVMLTSGYTEQEAADRIDGDAPDGFIQKPYRPAALVQKIQDMLAGAGTTVS